MLETGGPCCHPASPLDVTVVLCEQHWGGRVDDEKPSLEVLALGLGEAQRDKAGPVLFAGVWEVGAQRPQVKAAAP